MLFIEIKKLMLSMYCESKKKFNELDLIFFLIVIMY